jgi:hypothetical protein
LYIIRQSFCHSITFVNEYSYLIVKKIQFELSFVWSLKLTKNLFEIGKVNIPANYVDQFGEDLRVLNVQHLLGIEVERVSPLLCYLLRFLVLGAK